MNDQEEFEKWFDEYDFRVGGTLDSGAAQLAWQACAKKKNAIIEQQAKKLEALRGFADLTLRNQWCLSFP